MTIIDYKVWVETIITYKFRLYVHIFVYWNTDHKYIVILFMEIFWTHVTISSSCQTFIFCIKNTDASNQGGWHLCHTMGQKYFWNNHFYNFYSRHHSRFFDCLAHPNLSATLATDQKRPLSHLCISYQSLAECH